MTKVRKIVFLKWIQFFETISFLNSYFNVVRSISVYLNNFAVRITVRKNVCLEEEGVQS